jgi:hypothetical protein
MPFLSLPDPPHPNKKIEPSSKEKMQTLRGKEYLNFFMYEFLRYNQETLSLLKLELPIQANFNAVCNKRLLVVNKCCFF